MNTNDLAQEARIPNPALKKFEILIGEWKTVGTHFHVEHTILEGKCSFGWIEGGAFLIWRSFVNHKLFPAGISILGSDDATGELFMLYFDQRKVSRKQNVSFENNVFKWWRNAPGFSQRYTLTISEDGNTIDSKGELSQDGDNWQKDLDQVFTRIRSEERSQNL
ncbi:MAG TPA: hypothetical protein VGC95_04890 [Chitinophagaceae bacterium]